jgi:hypothetical protein
MISRMLPRSCMVLLVSQHPTTPHIFSDLCVSCSASLVSSYPVLRVTHAYRASSAMPKDIETFFLLLDNGGEA